MNRKHTKIIECIIYGVIVLALIVFTIWQRTGGAVN